MSWTKRQFISQSLLEIGLGEDFNLQPEEFESALRSLDSMMAMWNGKGIRLGYLLPHTPDDSDIDSLSGVPDYANEAIYLNLAIRLAPRYGKVISVDTKITAKQAYDVLMSRSVAPMPQPMPNTMPIGAGNKYWRHGYGNPFFPTPAPVLEAGADDPLNF